MKMTPVTSSNIAAIGHCSGTAQLAVKFKNGKTFVYSDVSPDEHAALMSSASIGKHFNQFIKAVKVGREVVTAENETTDIVELASNIIPPAMITSDMSDKEKIKVLREALGILTKSILLSSREALDKVVMDSIDNANDTLLATKDGE